jgi:ankyrin repeat protein
VKKLVVCLLLASCLACKRSPQDAREELAKLGIPFTSEEFIGRCGVGPTHLIETFLVAGADPNVVYDGPQQSSTPLMAAASAGRLDIAKLLLKAGARPDLVAGDGRSALDAAANNCKHPEVVKFFMDLGSKPGEQSLFRALWDVEAHTMDCSHATVQYLLEAGADPNQRNAKGLTPLMVATDRVDTESVRLLLARKPDVNVQAAPYRWTALHMACGRALANRRPDTLEIVQALLKAGADPNLKDSFGRNPLEMLGSASVTPNLNSIREAITSPR